jgi:hypothetical protein
VYLLEGGLRSVERVAALPEHKIAILSQEGRKTAGNVFSFRQVVQIFDIVTSKVVSAYYEDSTKFLLEREYFLTTPDGWLVCKKKALKEEQDQLAVWRAPE